MSLKLKCLIALLSIQKIVSTENPIKFADKILPKKVLLEYPQQFPTKKPATCKQVWQPDGWVCKANEVVSYAEKDALKMQQVKAEWNDLIDQLVELNTLLLQKYPKFKQNPASHHIKYLLLWDIEGVKKDATKCWDQMEKIRKVSLCYTCSASNYKYFLKRRGLMPYGDCYDLLQNCRSHFSSIKDYNDIRFPLRDFFRDHINSNYHQNHAEYLDNYEHRLFSLFFVSILRPHDQENNAKVCENCITLSGRPVIDQLIKKFKRESEAMLRYLKKPARSLHSRSNWEPRGLFQEENIEDLLKRNVEVVFPGLDGNPLRSTFSDNSNTMADLFGKKAQNFSMVPW